MIVLTEKTSKFPQPIIFRILVFSCHKMTLITIITGMPLTHSTKEWEVIPALPYLSYRNLTFPFLLKTPRQEVWSRHFALLLISWTQKFEDLEFFMIVYHTLHLIEVMYSNNLLLIMMQLQWSEWFVNVLKQNVWGEQRGSCWTHGHQAPSSRRCVLTDRNYDLVEDFAFPRKRIRRC